MKNSTWKTFFPFSVHATNYRLISLKKTNYANVYKLLKEPYQGSFILNVNLSNGIDKLQGLVQSLYVHFSTGLSTNVLLIQKLGVNWLKTKHDNIWLWIGGARVASIDSAVFLDKGSLSLPLPSLPVFCTLFLWGEARGQRGGGVSRLSSPLWAD